MLQYFLGITPKQKVLPTGVAVRRYNQEISRQIANGPDDFIARVKGGVLDCVDFLIHKLCAS